MASRTKKAVAAQASDTVTFKKSELVSKLKSFLEDEGACDGDWLNKVKVEFLGQKNGAWNVQLKVAAEVTLDIASDGVPSNAEVVELIRSFQDEGCIDFDFDESDFEIVKISKV